MFEHGFLLSLKSRLNDLWMRRTKKQIELYESKKEFVQEVSSKSSPNVKLENIQNLFFYFGGFLTLVLLVFVLDKCLFKKQRKIKSKLLRCLAIGSLKLKFKGLKLSVQRMVVKLKLNLKSKY